MGIIVLGQSAKVFSAKVFHSQIDSALTLPRRKKKHHFALLIGVQGDSTKKENFFENNFFCFSQSSSVQAEMNLHLFAFDFHIFFWIFFWVFFNSEHIFVQKYGGGRPGICKNVRFT